MRIEKIQSSQIYINEYNCTGLVSEVMKSLNKGRDGLDGRGGGEKSQLSRGEKVKNSERAHPYLNKKMRQVVFLPKRDSFHSP